MVRRKAATKKGKANVTPKETAQETPKETAQETPKETPKENTGAPATAQENTGAVDPVIDAIINAPRIDHKVPPMPEFIMVRAVGSNQYEPFQRIAIPTSQEGVPVKRSNWVRAQLKAGVIVQV